MGAVKQTDRYYGSVTPVEYPYLSGSVDAYIRNHSYIDILQLINREYF